MSIVSFIRDLLPTFGKRDVRDKVRNITKKFSEICKPSLAAMAETMDQGGFVSAYAQLFAKQFQAFIQQSLRNVKPASPYEMSQLQLLAPYLYAACENAERLLDLLEQYVGKNLTEQVHAEALTYQKASALRMIELLDFFADYTIRNLAMITAAETNMLAFDRSDKNPYSPAELNYLVNNRGGYFQLIALLNNDPKKLFDTLEDIPEVIITDAGTDEVPALASAQADPLRLGFIPIVSFCFRWVGIRKVDYEIERYERAKKEKRDIELRLEALRQRRGGNMDAQNEKFIENYERELTLVHARIAQFEEASK